jgi:hypothetical protein
MESYLTTQQKKSQEQTYQTCSDTLTYAQAFSSIVTLSHQKQYNQSGRRVLRSGCLNHSKIVCAHPLLTQNSFLHHSSSHLAAETSQAFLQISKMVSLMVPMLRPINRGGCYVCCELQDIYGT